MKIEKVAVFVNKDQHFENPGEEQDNLSETSNKKKTLRWTRFYCCMSSESDFYEEENDEGGDGKLESAMGI